MHIIYAAQNQRRLPANYIIYQTEVPGSHHFAPHYNRMLQRARAVWDYHPHNISHYQYLNANVQHISPGIALQQAGKKDIPVLFYGWLNGSKHRTDWLAHIQQHCGHALHVETNKMGAEMWQLLARARIVVNIHYFQQAPLELFRIHEALSHGCHVVTEGKPLGGYHHLHYCNSPQLMAHTINMLLSSPTMLQTQPPSAHLCNREALKKALACL